MQPAPSVTVARELLTAPLLPKPSGPQTVEFVMPLAAALLKDEVHRTLKRLTGAERQLASLLFVQSCFRRNLGL